MPEYPRLRFCMFTWNLYSCCIQKDHAVLCIIKQALSVKALFVTIRVLKLFAGLYADSIYTSTIACVLEYRRRKPLSQGFTLLVVIASKNTVTSTSTGLCQLETILLFTILHYNKFLTILSG